MVAVEWKLVELIIIIFSKKCWSKIFYRWWQPAATDGESVNRTPSHVTFSRLCTHVQQCRTWHWLKVFVHVIPSMLRAQCLIWSLFDSPLGTLHSLSHHPLHSPNLHLHLLCGSVRREVPGALPRKRSWALWPTTPRSQVMSPKSSTTTTSQRPLKFSSRSPPATAGPRTCMTWRLVTTPSAEALSSPLFTQEREEPAGRRQAYHSPEESLSSQSSSVGHVRTGRPVDEFGSLISNGRENPCRDSENEQIRILLDRQKVQILADFWAEIEKHEFQAVYDRRSTQKLNGVIECQRGEINRALAGDEQLRRDQKLLHEQLLEQNRVLREAHEKSLNELEELKRFQGSTFDTFSRRN